MASLVARRRYSTSAEALGPPIARRHEFSARRTRHRYDARQLCVCAGFIASLRAFASRKLGLGR